MTAMQYKKHIVSLMVLAHLCVACPTDAQDRFETLPGYEAYRDTLRDMRNFVREASVSDVVWLDDRTRMQYRSDGSYYVIDLTTGALTPIDEENLAKGSPSARDSNDQRGGRRNVRRGRQSDREQSPDGVWTAEFRDWNVHLKKEDGSYEFAVTSDGTRQHKYGTGSWVYGEELRQTTAMWWSPDSRYLAFYEFDETGVQEFYLTPGLTRVQNELYIEAYPKPGAANPIVALHVYDLSERRSIRVPIGDDTEQYIYNVRWTPDSRELMYNRTNRHQNKLDVIAFDPVAETTRTVVREQQESWQENSPMLRWLSDDERFIWETERTGWKQFELRHRNGQRLNPLSRGNFPAASIVLIDEDAGWMYYTAYSAETHIHAQLHRVRLDGSQKQRITTRDLNYSGFQISPDHTYVVATMQSIDSPPAVAVYGMQGREIAVLAESDVSRMSDRPMPELFQFLADDGETVLYGQLFKPSDFDPEKQYPLLVNVYGGPLSQGVSANFRPADPTCEFGIITAEIDNRGTRNRGKAFEAATYLQLGTVDLGDQVAGVQFLTQRPYIDADRVGITGHSYGGYLAALAILRYPDVFHVAVAGSAVTDWRNYDTIYTERFMRTPQENEDGYRDGSTLTYAENLRGKLLLLHGMVDDNVHPNNIWQLVDALQKARKPFSMMFFPNSGHGIGSPSVQPLTWEFLVDNLVIEPQTKSSGG
ncbi:MAG: DPP IV N-terminal domain-containing protein [Phycisphaerales bacterium]